MGARQSPTGAAWHCFWRSADWQSAVSQIGNPPGVVSTTTIGLATRGRFPIGDTADYQFALPPLAARTVSSCTRRRPSLHAAVDNENGSSNMLRLKMFETMMSKNMFRLALLLAGWGGLGAGFASAQPVPAVKTVFMIALENHDWTQRVPEGANGRPSQLFGNPAAPFVNSLVTPGNPLSAQVAYATRYYNVSRHTHPSEPNYIWLEAGTDFGIHTDKDPSVKARNLFTCRHLTGQLNAAGIAWKDYQEDLELSPSVTVSASGSAGPVNPYNGTTEYFYAVKHNPMQFFTDTQKQNVYPLAKLWPDLERQEVGRFNWVTPDQYNEMHSSLPAGFTYHGVHYTGDQAAIAEGDNCLSVIVPKIMASAAYQDGGAIFIWTDETVSTDDTNTTLPFIVISPLAKGHAYASTTVLSHASVLKTLDEIYGLAFQTNAVPAAEVNAAGTEPNRVAAVNDLSDLFQTGVIH